MVSFAAIVSAVALAATYSVTQAEPVIQKVPWYGPFSELDVVSIEKKYLTHIVAMRNLTELTTPDFIAIDQNGRPNAYNEDTGVCSIAVNNVSMFKGQSDFRRSELVQFYETKLNETILIRTSLRKDEEFVNLHEWQCLFDEMHILEVRINVRKLLLEYRVFGGATKWETVFKYRTWFNFGFAVSTAPSHSGHMIKFYASEGDEELKLKNTHIAESALPDNLEYHFGMLTLTDDKTPPVMNGTDIMLFNGVSVTVGDLPVADGPACH